MFVVAPDDDAFVDAQSFRGLLTLSLQGWQPTPHTS